MSRIKVCFDSLKAQGRQALIPYITAGDPKPSLTVAILQGLVAAGADILEIGVPFSDPMADGPVITKAHERALAHHVSLRNVLEMVTEFRKQDEKTPIVLMGYLNPIEVMGYETFAQLAKEAGVDGVLTVDLPPEEAEEFTVAIDKVGIDPIYLLSPTTTEARTRLITQAARGYVYYVSLKGVTGASTLDVDEVARKVAAIRSVSNLPIGVGFGIKDAQSAAAVAACADGVVVGSVLVNCIASWTGDDQGLVAALSAILNEMRVAMDA
jgi:tryptophan synthase alpha chain